MPEPEPSDAELVAEGVKGLVARPFELAGRALGAAQRPGRAARRGREAAEGLGEVVWAGLNPAPDVPLNVPIGPPPARLVGASRLATSRRSRTRSAARSTTRC